MEEVKLTNEEKTPEKKPRFFNAGEIVAIIVTFLIIVILLLTLIDTSPPFVSSDLKTNYTALGYESNIYQQPETSGQSSYRQNPFGAVAGTYRLHYPNNTSDEEQKRVDEIFAYVTPKLHALSDRHNYYTLEAIYPDGYSSEPLIKQQIPSNPKIMSLETANSEEVKNGTRLNNLRVINESLNLGKVEVPYDLYELLRLSCELSIKTNSAFNIFVGELSDWWNTQIDVEQTYDREHSDPMNNEASAKRLATLKSYVPLNEEQIKDTLIFSEENGNYYVEFKKEGVPIGDLSITLGGIAKGYANEVIKTHLLKEELNQGLLFGSASSIDVLSPYFIPNENWKIILTSYSVGTKDNNYNKDAFGITFGKTPFSLATSAGDQFMKNYYITNKDGKTYHRHHIIDATTGEPANHQIVDVNIISTVLTSAELDALTTALMCLSLEDGQALVKAINEQYPVNNEDEVILGACWLMREKFDAPFEAFATSNYFPHLVALNNITITKIN